MINDYVLNSRKVMDKFLTKRPRSSSEHCGSSSQQQQPHVEINLNELPSDPGLRPRITTYHPNDQDKIRRAYLQKGLVNLRITTFHKEVSET